MGLGNHVERRGKCWANHDGMAAESLLANRGGNGLWCHLTVLGKLEIKWATDCSLLGIRYQIPTV